MEPIKLELFNKYLEIKQDLMNNLQDIPNRTNYYSKKYRGDIVTDINVGLGVGENGKDYTIQIFLRHKELYIKDNIKYNLKGLFSSTIKSNLNE